MAHSTGNTTESLLDEIVARRRERVDEARRRVPLERLARAAESRTDFRSFSKSLAAPGISVIAEMKKASPSAGLLRSDYRCRELAQEYERAGARALSVLTEEDHFRGSLEHLVDARAATTLPVLRKDFVLDEYQVYEAAAAGADCLLLIVAALAAPKVRSLLELSAELGIEALVEVHADGELSRALDAGARIVGVNNRNLKTLEVNLDTSLRLREKIPSGRLTVTESGIRSGRDLRRLLAAGFDAALVGEQFMRAADPGQALRELLADTQ